MRATNPLINQAKKFKEERLTTKRERVEEENVVVRFFRDAAWGNVDNPAGEERGERWLEERKTASQLAQVVMVANRKCVTRHSGSTSMEWRSKAKECADPPLAAEPCACGGDLDLHAVTDRK